MKHQENISVSEAVKNSMKLEENISVSNGVKHEENIPISPQISIGKFQSKR